MLDVQGFILVGGASSRMGTDKSQLVFGDEIAVRRIASALSSLAARIFLVGGQPEHANLGLESIPDVRFRWGALGGIHTALAACAAEWAAIVACDLPFVSRDLLLRLAEFAHADRHESTDAIVPIQPDLRPQPLAALYRVQPCLQEAERLIAAGEHAPRTLLAAVQTRRVEFQELADLPGARHLFLNVNTPADYEQAKEILGKLRNRS